MIDTVNNAMAVNYWAPVAGELWLSSKSLSQSSPQLTSSMKSDLCSDYCSFGSSINNI